MRERGTTALDLVLHTIQTVEPVIAETFARIRSEQRLGPKEREALSRRLAGVVGGCESIRVWLGAGAPR